MPSLLHFQSRFRSIKDHWILLMLYFLCEALKQRGELTAWEQEAYTAFRESMEPAGFGCRSLSRLHRDFLSLPFPSVPPGQRLP